MAFSHITDRPVAIAGLEARLCRAFDSEGGFGVFEIYPGRSILWQRAPDTAALTQINFPPAQEYVPSWSWMAYHGAITYLQPPLAGVDWCNNDFHLSGTPKGYTSTSRENVGRHWQKAALQVTARRFRLQPTDSASKSDIVWDQDEMPAKPLRCVIIGKMKSPASLQEQACYILVVQEVERGKGYQRAGVGVVEQQDIELDDSAIDTVLH